MTGYNTKTLISHISTHKEYKELYDKLKADEEKETKTQQGQMMKFLNTGILVLMIYFNINFRRSVRRPKSYQFHCREQFAIFDSWESVI